MTVSSVAARFAYGSLFCLALPALLVWWARQLNIVLLLPSMEEHAIGWWVAAAGCVLVLWSMLALRVQGGGLPMNAFPPPMAVDRGPYAMFAHPIYFGAVMIAFGVALATGSAAGVRIVAPTLALACVALVLGYERADLVRRFGSVPGGALLRLPDRSEAPPSWRDRASVWIGLFAPFLLLYEAVGHLPVPDAVNFTPSESAWPTYPETTPIYSLAYLMVFLAPLAFAQKRAMRT